MYEENLEKNPDAFGYIVNRGIDIQTIKNFRLGYADYNYGYRHLVQEFSPDDLLATGLFKENGQGNCDYFRNRITIPIVYSNEVRHFTSREYPEKEDGLKHLHQKGHIEVCINHDILKKFNYVFITEGPFDCMTLVQNGIAAIGLLGAHRLSRKTIEDLHDKKIYICLDSDPNKTGQKAALKLARKLMSYNIASYIVPLPEEDKKVDVNSFFMTHKIGDFMKCIQKAQFFNEVQPVKVKSTAKDLTPIMKAVEKYVSGRSINNRFVGKCIFHEEKTGSMVIYEKDNQFHCFGCGKHGSTLDIIVRGEELRGNKISYKQAKEIATQL